MQWEPIVVNVEVTASGDGPNDPLAMIRAKYVTQAIHNALEALTLHNGLHLKLVSRSSVGSQIGRTMQRVVSISPTKPVMHRALSKSLS